ncbi:uncharacterized protein EV422DRAFT_191710 [Fimicolochytrium jonesii]|uniref:uncharacterized protein n=1 Tax=Fimicolochytrium jonesii TaxID=1396493 RepID=UPI0022FF1F8D|nr:uncharacterized protein EV422DRAFT_191710 [Fimicolochytrium jonesii]KAI8818143.1 hypothetical protein EV422DRAFT_191710 [Fimicolochytrium jonesii]
MSVFSSKIEGLDGKLDRKAAIKFNTADFMAFTEAPRNYSLFVCLTALAPEMSCLPCSQFEREYNLVAKSWHKAGVPHSLYFAQLDFSAGREIFDQFHVKTVPMVLHYPPTEGPLATDDSSTSDEPEHYNLNRQGFKAEALARYASDIVKHEFIIKRPMNWEIYGTMVGSFILLAFFIALAWPAIVAGVQSRKVWSTVLIAWVVIMSSGHMWNSIRGPPYTGTRDKQPEFISPGFQNQYILETHIIAVLYAACSISFVALVTRIPTISHPASQRSAAYACAAGFVIVYSLALRLFRAKNGSYPYKLLF